jgi:hypothetical protein
MLSGVCPLTSKFATQRAKDRRYCRSIAQEEQMHDGLSTDYLMSLATLPNVLSAIGVIFYVASMSMKTVIPLRITGLVSAFFLLGAAILTRSVFAMVLYALLLPVHSIRLYQMFELIKKVREAPIELNRSNASKPAMC